jgi:hypothetical protein
MPASISRNDELAVVTDLKVLQRLIDESGTARVVLALDLLTSDQRAEWERRLNREHNACGCGEATIFLLATAALLATLYAFARTAAVPVPAMAWFVATALCITSIGVGKAFGRYRARRRFHAALLGLHTSASLHRTASRSRRAVEPQNRRPTAAGDHS